MVWFVVCVICVYVVFYWFGFGCFVVFVVGRDVGCGYYGGGNGLDLLYVFGGLGKLVFGGGGG